MIFTIVRKYESFSRAFGPKTFNSLKIKILKSNELKKDTILYILGSLLKKLNDVK